MPCTIGSRAYSVSAMTAGSRPMPRMPQPGSAAARPLSGAISSPNSAIDGTVWITLSAANKGVASRSLRAAATPSGTPISKDGSSVAATICTWRSPAAWNTSSPIGVLLQQRELVERARRRAARTTAAAPPRGPTCAARVTGPAAARHRRPSARPAAPGSRSRRRATRAISVETRPIGAPPRRRPGHSSPASSSAADTTAAAWTAREGRTKIAQHQAGERQRQEACAAGQQFAQAPARCPTPGGSVPRSGRPGRAARPAAPSSSAASTRL